MSALDPTLLSLFQEEVRGNLRFLDEGLVGLEEHPDDLRRVEPLMRAAHSVKGAVRIAGLDDAVGLAHALEECLVLAQNGRLALTAGDLDVMLRAVDLLGRMAEALGPDSAPGEEQRDAANQLLGQLREVVQGTHAPPMSPPPPGDDRMDGR